MTRYCIACETWWDNDDVCLFCGDPGVPARAQHASARSWRNPATWVAPNDKEAS